MADGPRRAVDLIRKWRSSVEQGPSPDARNTIETRGRLSVRGFKGFQCALKAQGQHAPPRRGGSRVRKCGDPSRRRARRNTTNNYGQIDRLSEKAMRSLTEGDSMRMFRVLAAAAPLGQEFRAPGSA